MCPASQATRAAPTGDRIAQWCQCLDRLRRNYSFERRLADPVGDVKWYYLECSMFCTWAKGSSTPVLKEDRC